VERKLQEISLPAARRPDSLIFDSGVHLPAELRVEKANSERAVDLARGPTPADRARAARALGRARATEFVPALRDSLHGDPFWGVRAWAADALAELGHPDAREALRGGLRDPDPRVRAVCVGAMAAEGPSVGGVLLDVVAREASDLVVAAALRGLGQARAEGAWQALVTALGRDSAGERLRLAAVDGLAALGDSRGLPLLLEQSAPGRDAKLRVAAIAALGRLGRGQAAATSRLRRLLADERPGVRAAAGRALAGAAERSARDELRAAVEAEDHPLFRRQLEAALEGLDAAR
jgi:HEAT repeat protein